jgi:choloylglycine hydrolase
MKIFCTLVLTLVMVSAHACTGIKLTAADGSAVHGRTLEFAMNLDTSVVVVPRGYAFAGTVADGKGLSYTAKYAMVGAMLFDDLAVVDGINEKGLAVGTFYFPGYAEYASLGKENQAAALSPIDFPSYVLAQCATLEEVRAVLAKVVIADTPLASWGNQTPPFHYIVYDKKGRSLVIEPLEGKLVAYDNKLGVLTNSPTFDWHMTNLRNYIHLAAFNPPPLEIEGITLEPFGQGAGLVGLPGDFTPPSRFVRAALFTATALPAKTSREAVLQAFHILNQFDIPLGSVRGEGEKDDYTMLTCVRDPNALRYYFKTYENQSICVVALQNFDLKAKTIKRLSTKGPQKIDDLSAELKPGLKSDSESTSRS